MPADYKVRATVNTERGAQYLTATVENVDDEQHAVAVFRRRHKLIELHRVLRVSTQKERRER